MKKVVFLSDYFHDQVSGGAEIYDSILIEELESLDTKVVRFNCREFTVKHFNLYLKTGFNFIVSNFVFLSEEVKSRLKACGHRYVVIEHDHKYLIDRDPSNYKDFIAPSNRIVNREFYKSAKMVFCQSVKHYEVVKSNLNIENITNLGCSLWSKKQLNIIKNSFKQEKNGRCFVIQDPNPIKGLEEAKHHCDLNNLNYDVLAKQEYSKFIESISSYEKFVFFPKTLESFCRVVLEARMLECKIITNNLNGCTHEEWFSSLSGLKLVDFVNNKRSEVVAKIADCIFEEKAVRQEDIVVILNCYRRPHNLEMQIEAIRNQSVAPKEIWLWINYHEDNKNLDTHSLKVDRIFNNNFNWKFYGRFAAALLADSEYIAIYDDDTIPGENWHKNCLDTMKTSPGILGSAGVILDSQRYVEHERCGWPTLNKHITEVDLVGHAWFFKRDWLKYLWQEKPPTWDNGEDIQFSFMAKTHGNIPTYCPPHPPDDRSLHGSVLGNELGIDDKATSTNSAVSYNQFFSERDMCVQESLKGGWKTVKKVKL